MNQYYTILLWLMALGFLSASISSQHTEIVCGQRQKRYNYIWAILILLPLIWMVANRTDTFGDTIVYRQNFQLMPDTIAGIPAYLASVTKDKGFRVLSCLIKVIVGNQDKLYFAILAIIQGGAVIFVYRKYSPAFWISTFLFFASSDYVAWMYNGIRQFTAATIIFAGTKLIYEKRFFSAIVLILFASTMHQSALIMIPIIFIVQGKAFNFRTIIAFLLMLLAIVFVDRFTGILSTVLEDTQYTNVVSDYVAIKDDGTNPLRVLVYSVPAILSFIFRRRVEHAGNSFMNMCVNMAVITMGIYAVSMVTSGIFLGRLPIYTSLYGYILLPWLINEVFEEKSQKIVYIGMIIAYLIFYYYQMHLTWGLL